VDTILDYCAVERMIDFEVRKYRRRTNVTTR
jgi:hypothetical protein